MTRRFAVGDAVRVKTLFPPGHVRTPFYCRGKSGIVERICGEFGNPESLAYGDYDGEQITLYRVRFLQSELWSDYDGTATDKTDIEIYEHWLEAGK